MKGREGSTGQGCTKLLFRLFLIEVFLSVLFIRKFCAKLPAFGIFGNQKIINRKEPRIRGELDRTAVPVLKFSVFMLEISLIPCSLFLGE